MVPTEARLKTCRVTDVFVVFGAIDKFAKTKPLEPATVPCTNDIRILQKCNIGRVMYLRPLCTLGVYEMHGIQGSPTNC